MLNIRPASIIDCHCHLDFTDFDHDREQVLQRAATENISHIIIPGTEKKHWPRITQLCKTHLRCLPSYGLHPYWTNKHNKKDLGALENYLSNNIACGIGECGLDFREGQADKKLQLYYFDAQLNISQQFKLPAIIHAVNSTETVIQQIKSTQNNPSSLRGMIHSYSGSLEQAMQLVDLGFLISIGGSVTNENNKKVRRTVEGLPLSSLLLETDAPDQIPVHNIKSKRNEPAFIKSTLKIISDLKGISIEEVSNQTTNNARDLFPIPA